MDMKQEYVIAIGWHLDGFVNQVNERIKEGYRPLGGVSTAISSDDDVQMFTQALVRDLEE